MARGVPSADPSPSAWPRGWLDYEEYKLVHSRYLAILYDEGVIATDDLIFEEVYDETTGAIAQVGLSGSVTCACGAKVRVSKWMETNLREGGGFDVRTVYYQYHAWWPKLGKKRQQALVRYDQAHGSEPHRHYFDPTGRQISHERLTLDTMPRLDAVIREAAALVTAFAESD